MATDDTTTTDEPLLTYVERVEVPAHISRETWNEIVSFAEERLEYDPEADAHRAFWDAFHQFVSENTTVIVEGEVKTPADLPSAQNDDGGDSDVARSRIQSEAAYQPDEQIPLKITLDPPADVLDAAGGWDQLVETAQIRRAPDGDE